MKLALSVALFAACLVAAQGKQPNIIIMLADDLGYHDIGFRSDFIKTPVLDKMAKEGIIMTNSYVTQQCTPSRHSLMTGRYPHTSGMNHGVLADVLPWCSELQYKFLPSYLKDLGYNTHMLGKWHLGNCRKECTPAWRGFDTFEGAFAGQGHYFNHTTEEGAYDWFKQDQVDRSADGKHSQDLIQDGAIKIIKESDGETPLFMYLSFHNTHSPMEPKEEFLEPYLDLKVSETRRNYLGLLGGLDYAIGQIMDELKAANLYENTIIFFSSDNGGDAHEGDNSPLRGAKGSLWEGGVRGNMFIHSPLLEKSGYENDGLMHVSDWLPTMVSMAGGSIPESDNLDGVDQSDLILRGAPSARDEMIYYIDREHKLGLPTCGEMAIRDERYKMIWGMPGFTDGYGMDAEKFYDMEFYQQAVADAGAALNNSREKRGGRPNLNPEQQLISDTYTEMVMITEEQFEAGTGMKKLFDLKEDPFEKNDLADSDDPEHQKIINDFTRRLQNAYATNYNGVKKETQIPDMRSLPFNFGGAVGVGWCQDKVPLPDNLTSKCDMPKKGGKNCDSTMPRYYYNSKQNKCRKFEGCAAEGNNFAHKRVCKSACVKEE